MSHPFVFRPGTNDEAMFAVSPVLGGLAIIGAFLLFRQWLPTPVAIIATATFAFNKAFLYYASYLLAHVVAAGTLLLETCFPLVLFVPRLRWLLIPGAAAMHVGIRLALGLDYSAQWLTVVIVFVNWPVAVARLRHVLAHVPAPREAPG